MTPTITTHLDIEDTDTCPECDGRIRPTEAAETVCDTCGLVLTEAAIDHGPEWRFTTDPDDNQRRTGGSLTNTHANRGLSTWMGTCERDAKGNTIDGEKRRRLRRQRKQQRRTAADATKDTLQPGLDEIGRLCSELDLREAVEETASVVYRRASGENLLYGWSYESIASAATFVAARNTGAIRTLTEVVAVSHHGERRVARAIRHLQRELNLGVEPPSVVEYVPTIASDLGLSKRHQRLARDLLEAAIDENIHSGRDPSALAASALYAVTLAVSDTPDLCQTEISGVVEVCPLTIRSHFRELRPLCPQVFGVDADAIETPQSRSGKRSQALSTGDRRTKTGVSAD